MGIYIPESVAQEIYSEIFDFANYAFNKAHAVCYAIIAYQTAYFKRHYPREYMSALLTSVLNITDKVVEYIGECKNMGIRLLSPDINESGAGFTPTKEGIRFGLVAVKGVGSGVIDRLLAQRKQDGLFTDLEDFCKRLSGSDLKRFTLENLIRCGAFDSLGHFRSQLITVYEKVLQESSSNRKENVFGQIDLFGTVKEKPPLVLPNIPEFTLQERMMMEKESTGLYLSGHPMENFRRYAQYQGCPTIFALKSDLENENKRFQDGQVVLISGVITQTKTKMTRKSTLMAYVSLEDETGTIELIVFSRAIDKFSLMIYPGSPVLVQGKISVREEKSPQILVNSFFQLTEAQSAPAKKEKLYVKFQQEYSPIVEKMKNVISMFPGDYDVILYFADTKKRQLGTCNICQSLVHDLESRLGPENVVVQ